jgi:hypothetical protein
VVRYAKILATIVQRVHSILVIDLSWISVLKTPDETSHSENRLLSLDTDLSTCVPSPVIKIANGVPLELIDPLEVRVIDERNLAFS